MSCKRVFSSAIRPDKQTATPDKGEPVAEGRRWCLENVEEDGDGGDGGDGGANEVDKDVGADER